LLSNFSDLGCDQLVVPTHKSLKITYLYYLFSNLSKIWKQIPSFNKYL